MHTKARREFYGAEQYTAAEGEIEHCVNCGRMADPLDSLKEKRAHRTGACV